MVEAVGVEPTSSELAAQICYKLSQYSRLHASLLTAIIQFVGWILAAELLPYSNDSVLLAVDALAP